MRVVIVKRQQTVEHRTKITSCMESDQKGLEETRTGRKNTAKRETNMPMHYRHAPVYVDTVFIDRPSQTKPYQSSEQSIAWHRKI